MLQTIQLIRITNPTEENESKFPCLKISNKKTQIGTQNHSNTRIIHTVTDQKMKGGRKGANEISISVQRMGEFH